jgi:hypothetical protein
MPAAAMKTYSIREAGDTTVVAACADVGCEQWANGWETYADEADDHGAAVANYIRRDSGRTFREMRTATGITVFRFEPGQRCFREHHTKPELYLVRGGDWRGNPLAIPTRRHANPADWVEEIQIHQDRLAETIKQG